MYRPAFSFDDIAAECTVTTGCYRLDGRLLGLRIAVPEALHGCHPFNASAYDFLQQLRKEIFKWGIIEFPGLPLNFGMFLILEGMQNLVEMSHA